MPPFFGPHVIKKVAVAIRHGEVSLLNVADNFLVKLGLEREIKELDRQIKEARRNAAVSVSLEEKLEGQKKIKALEAQRNQQRRSLFEAQDDVDRQREQIIATVEQKLKQQTRIELLFAIRWKLN